MEPESWVVFFKALLGGAIGAGAVFFGLSRWLGQLWLGRLLAKDTAKYNTELEKLKVQYAQELERFKDALERSQNLLRSEVERSVFVTRAQFEIEFTAYKQVFEALAQLRIAIGGTRPMISVSPENETKEDKLKGLAGRLSDLIEAKNKAVTVVENLSPFYPVPLYVQLIDSLKAAKHEIIDIQTGGNETFTIGWFQQGDERMGEFMTAYNAASDAIRTRIATLAVLPRA